MREIITIQLGETANYVGTHFWNSLENSVNRIKEENKEIDNKKDASNEDYQDVNVFYRTGISSKREETYSPRLLIFELKVV